MRRRKEREKWRNIAERVRRGGKGKKRSVEDIGERKYEGAGREGEGKIRGGGGYERVEIEIEGKEK
jgi:hypothetical protein